MITITELDYALNCATVEIDTTNARAELAALRADIQRMSQDAEETERAMNELSFLSAEVTALQQAVNEARQSMLCAMDALDMEGIGDSRVFSAMREWLAAHPAPEATA